MTSKKPLKKTSRFDSEGEDALGGCARCGDVGIYYDPILYRHSPCPCGVIEIKQQRRRLVDVIQDKDRHWYDELVDKDWTNEWQNPPMKEDD